MVQVPLLVLLFLILLIQIFLFGKEIFSKILPLFLCFLGKDRAKRKRPRHWAFGHRHTFKSSICNFEIKYCYLFSFVFLSTTLDFWFVMFSGFQATSLNWVSGAGREPLGRVAPFMLVTTTVAVNLCWWVERAIRAEKTNRATRRLGAEPWVSSGGWRSSRTFPSSLIQRPTWWSEYVYEVKKRHFGLI